MTQVFEIEAAPQSPQSTELRALVRAVDRWAREEEASSTAIDGLMLFKSVAPGEPVNCVYEPCIGIIVQGEKQVSFGQEEHVLGPGRFFVTSIDLPTSAQITHATAEYPYLSFVLKLDLSLVNDVLNTLPAADDEMETAAARGLVVSASPPAMVDAFARLLALLDRPEELAVMETLIKREICFRLVQSEAGPWLRRMVSRGYRSNGVLRVLDWLKRNYDQPLEIETLADMAGMARSTLHHNFRSLTGTSPLQYQKCLRLYAARNMMKAERLDANTAAIRVGYESVSQFNREYARMFGLPPGRDMRQQRDALEAEERSLFAAQ